MLGPPVGFWGKLEERDGVVIAWHPLRDHCADVAACAEGLLRSTLLGRRLAQLGGVNELDEVQIARLCVLVALHDLGKFNQHFQNKGRPGAQPRAGHVREFAVILDDEARGPARARLEAVVPFDAMRRWGASDDTTQQLLCASVGHHGRPVPYMGNGVANEPDRWVVVKGLDPFVGMRELVEATRRWFPRAWSDGGAPLPKSAAFAHAFSGLVMLADWLGSSREFFPFADTLDDRIAFARRAAGDALRAMHLDADVDRRAMGPSAPGFSAVTGRTQPHDAQAKTLGLPLPAASSLTLLESETGSGKTEAALMRFLMLFHAGAVDGMYFALPTRTAATQIHERLTRLVARAFPDEATRPPVVLAVPGYLAVDDAKGTRLEHFEVLWKDDTKRSQRAPEFRHRAWAAEHPKRFLAAAIAVGTVDQVLLSTLTVDHAHLRATSLLRQLLVVDEVHASDAYMGRLLEEALRFHRDAGGHALLMSATLGSALRERLFRGTTPPLDEAVATPYPLVTHREGSQRTPHAITNAGSPKGVRFERSPHIDDPEAVARMALDHASKGARVLVLRNTVRDAVATQEALEALATREGKTGLLFRCGTVVTLHHARFAKVDRALLDAAIERDFGTESPSVGRVAVATQTVQQALDLDADLLITDLCPMDVLLQRVGRLHRHKREGKQRRPDGYTHAVAVVLVPAERDLSKLVTKSGEPRGKHGHGTVYDDLRVLHATWCQIEATPDVFIPKMNRALVEHTTHPDALAAVLPVDDPRWAKHREWCEGSASAERRAATLVLVERGDKAPPFGEYAFPEKGLGDRISTRLGEGDRRAVFEAPPTGPFGERIRELTVPTFMARGVAPDAVAAVTEQSTTRFVFAFGAERFVYDRLGLRPFNDPVNPAEDLSDV
jgi:CRISPR-associated endonuclease/helicase Cas3